MSEAAMKKLDPGLRILVKTMTDAATRRAPAAPAAKLAPPAAAAAAAPVAPPGDEEPCVPPMVIVVLRYIGEVAELEALGLVRPIVFANPNGLKIVSGGIAPERLLELAAHPHVITMEESKPLDLSLDQSVRAIHARQLHTADPALTGKGVVIGIIDAGLDWRHGAFHSLDEITSRIIEIWDQGAVPRAGETRGPVLANSPIDPVTGNPLGVGVLYDKAWIESALLGSKTIQTADKLGTVTGHGTHVAGIAAGDGSPSSCCSCGTSDYVGVAPGAEIIAVRYDSRYGWQPGLDYLQNHPYVKDKPLVVNLSMGRGSGARDGTDSFELAIDAFVASKSPTGNHARVMVVAAGNEGTAKQAFHGTVPAPVAPAVNATLTIDLEVPERDSNTAFIEIWFARALSLDLQVTDPTGFSTGFVTLAAADPTVFPPAPAPATLQISGVVGTAAAPPVPEIDTYFEVRIAKQANGFLLPHRWQLTLRNSGAAPVDIHAWIAGRGNTTFVAPSEKSTLKIPATAAGAIVVANHEVKTDADDEADRSGIHDSSSRGPVRKGAVAKPTIAAPGFEITSAKHDAKTLKGNCDGCCECCCYLYQDMTGTSMAAPHVTGAIALLLELDKTLTRDEIVGFLDSGANKGVLTAPDSGDTWGGGKLDVKGAVDKYIEHRDGPAAHALRAAAPPAAAAALSDLPQSPGLDGPAPAFAPLIELLRRRFRAIRDGELVAALVSRHFSEVRRLINHNQKVATMWHRADGPRMLRRIAAGAFDAAAPKPIQTDEQRDYLARLFEQLQRHGSPRLQTSIERYQSTFVRLLETPLAAQIAPPSPQDAA